ncbi:MAG: glutathione S-transferase family protein [Chthoniobacterales bacterium]
MSLTIYQVPISPYCISTLQALKALRASVKIVNVNYATRDEVIQASGGKYYAVPLLKDRSRVVMESSGDSQDIARYIDRKFGKGKLFPSKLEGLQSIILHHLENDVEGISFQLADPFFLPTLKDIQTRTLAIRHKERKFGAGCIAQWKKDRKAIQAKVDAMLLSYDKILRHSDFLFGSEPVYSDFMLFGVIGNFTFNGWNKLNPKFKALIRWNKRMGQFRYKASK